MIAIVIQTVANNYKYARNGDWNPNKKPNTNNMMP